MENFLAAIGIITLLAAIAGGGLKGLGFEFPALQSISRQTLLGVFGCILLIASSPVQVNNYITNFMTWFRHFIMTTYDSSIRDNDHSKISSPIDADKAPESSNTVQTPLHPSAAPQAPQLGKQSLTEESTRGKGDGSERLPNGQAAPRNPTRPSDDQVDQRNFVEKLYLPKPGYDTGIVNNFIIGFKVAIIVFVGCVIFIILRENIPMILSTHEKYALDSLYISILTVAGCAAVFLFLVASYHFL